MSRIAIQQSSEGRSVRSGVTLLELLVVLVILAVLAGVAVPHGPLGPATAAEGDSAAHRIATARREAIRTRVPVTITLSVNDSARMATAFPDGTVAADSVLRISPFDGAPHELP